MLRTRLLVSMAGLLALSATGCAVHTGAYVDPAAPVGYGYYGGDVAVAPAPYVAPVWREPVVVVRPHYYYAPRPYVRVAPRYYAPHIRYSAHHYGYGGAHHRW